MQIIKVARQEVTQDVNQAFETVYVIKGIFKKRVYRLDVLALVEIPTKELSREEKT